MDALLADLLKTVEGMPRKIDRSTVVEAWEFANLAHADQKRDSGERFIIHPTRVAKTLAEWNLDTTTVAAGLLHDTTEEGGATRTDIVEEFGEEVARIVDGVTKITGIHLVGSEEEEEFVENLRKMLLVMARDLRVVLIKLADRLHNMQTLEYIQPERQLINAKETLEIYAPLAERLGMGEVKGILEDLAFKYVYALEYKNLVKQTSRQYKDAETYMESLRREMLSLLGPQLPQAKVNVRRKHLYSLYKKLQRPEIGGDLGKIYDLVAARILVDTVEECYLAMGLIHGKYHVVPYLGISDFIANPKPNGYRSIHTKIFGPQGKIVEVQIRTLEMHIEAEMGIAAHWQMSQLKSTGKLSSEDIDRGKFQVGSKLAWVKQLVSWQNKVTSDEEYLQGLKFDALAHRNLVFSPKGDVYDLPRGASAVDFAYAVHTKMGYQAAGAKVNGKMVGLNYQLKNGDVVEILVDRKRKRPSHEWLDFIVTRTARHQIQKALKKSEEPGVQKRRPHLKGGG